MPSPYQIVLSGQEQAVLAARARSVRGPCRDRLLATIVLAAAAGQVSAAIARELGVCADTVRKWRRRFTEGRLAGLAGAPRSGRPPVFTAADQAEVIALARGLVVAVRVVAGRSRSPDAAGGSCRTARTLAGRGVGAPGSRLVSVEQFVAVGANCRIPPLPGPAQAGW